MPPDEPPRDDASEHYKAFVARLIEELLRPIRRANREDERDDDDNEWDDTPRMSTPHCNSIRVIEEAFGLIENSRDIRREVIDAGIEAWKRVLNTGDEADELGHSAAQFAAAVWCRWAGGALPTLGEDLRAAVLDRFVAAKILPALRKGGETKSTTRASLKAGQTSNEESRTALRVKATLAAFGDDEEAVRAIAAKISEQAQGNETRKIPFRFWILAKAIVYWQDAAVKALLKTPMPPPIGRGATVHEIEAQPDPDEIPPGQSASAERLARWKRRKHWNKFGERWIELTRQPTPDGDDALWETLRREVNCVKFVGIFVLRLREKLPDSEERWCKRIVCELNECHDATVLFSPSELPPRFTSDHVVSVLRQWLAVAPSNRVRDDEPRLKRAANSVRQLYWRTCRKLGISEDGQVA